jgi:acetolactate synthase-1/2/3 large subunit
VTVKGHPAQIQKAAAMINEAQKPLIIAGSGVIISQASGTERIGGESADTGRDHTTGPRLFPESHVLSYRWLGMHGMAYANLAVNNADVIIAIGMRFDDRATSEVNTFAPNAKIIHIDIDPAEIGKNVSR